MPRSSPLSDDDDPLPRALRVLAACLGAEGELPDIARRLRWSAGVLEGEPMRDEDANRPLGRLLAGERRVAVRRGNRRRRRRTAEERRRQEEQERQWREQLQEAGLLREDRAEPRPRPDPPGGASVAATEESADQ